MDKDYSKIVYQSEPIGKEHIRLVLTTLDLEKFKEDENLTKIPTKKVAIDYEFNRYDLTNQNLISDLHNQYEDFIKKTYDNQLKEMQGYIEQLRAIKIVPVEYDTNAKNITNADDVHCNIVYGDIKNCDNIYCNEIKGNVVNCDKIIYK